MYPMIGKREDMCRCRSDATFTKIYTQPREAVLRTTIGDLYDTENIYSFRYIC